MGIKYTYKEPYVKGVRSVGFIEDFCFYVTDIWEAILLMKCIVIAWMKGSDNHSGLEYHMHIALHTIKHASILLLWPKLLKKRVSLLYIV